MTSPTDNGFANIVKSRIKREFGVSGALTSDDIAYDGSDSIKDKIDSKSDDSAVVHLTGDETIAGVKTFSSSPIVPTPTTDMEAATKKYVDDNIGSGDVTASGTLTADKIILGNGTKVVKTSSKGIVATLGSDDTSVPTSKAVKDVTDTKVTKVVSTDNAITRFDGTTGDVQNSSATIDDNGTASVNTVKLSPTPTVPTPAIGELYWDTAEKTVSVKVDTDSSLQIGQEQYVRVVNKTGVQINDGQVVYLNGAQGNRPTIALADATDNSKCHIIGVATQNIADNAEGFVTTEGVVRGYNTSGFGDGDVLYVSATTPGALTNVAPSSPNCVVIVGRALNSTNNGSILVKTEAVLQSNTALGTDNTAAPTQLAVKTYADTKSPLIYDAIVAPTGGDYTKLSAAITAGKKTIFVRKGTYTENTITISTDGTTVIGESKKDTIIRFNAGVDGIAQYANNCYFSNLTLDGETNNSSAVYIIGDGKTPGSEDLNIGNNNIVENCIIKGPNNTFAIYIAGPTYAVGSATLTGFQNDGLHTGNIVRNCELHSTWNGDAFSFSLQKNGAFDNNVCYGGRIAFYMPRNSSCSFNKVVSSANQGIFFAGPAYSNVIVGNTVYSPTSDGIKLENQLEHTPLLAGQGIIGNTIADNTIYNSGNNGISISGSSANPIIDNTFSGNVFDTSYVHGIYIQYAERNTIKSNVIKKPRQDAGSRGSGIYMVANVIDNIIEGNTISGTAYHTGIANREDSTCTGNIIKGNKIKGTNTERTVWIESNETQIIGNSIEGGNYAGIRLNNASFCIVTNNKCKNNTNDANNAYAEIWLQGSASNNIISNNVLSSTASNKAANGINVDGASCTSNIIGKNKFNGNVGAEVADTGTTTDKSQYLLSGTNTGNETATSIGALIGGSADATPNDTDFVATSLTAGGILKKITWTNVKAFLKTYFDTLYSTVTNALGKQIYHGVEGRTAGSPLPTNLTTTTFNLATNTTPLTYWRNGVKTVVNTAKSVVLPSSTAGLYYIYFDDDAGTLSASATFPGIDSATTTKVIIASVDWNGTDYGIVNDERHAHNRNGPLHVWAHNTIGARYGSGLTLTASGTGAAMTGSVTSGNIYDEDINFAIGAQTTFRQRYQTGASTSGFDKVLTTTPVKLGANNRPGMVNSSTYVWTEVASAVNRYVNYFVYASTTMLAPIHVFSETASPATIAAGGYTSLANARAVPFPNLSYYGLSPEFKPIYRLICRADGVLQAIDTTQDDYRTSSSIPFGAGTSSTTAAAVSFAPAGNVAATTVQTAIEELDTEKAPLASPTFTGTVTLPTVQLGEASMKLDPALSADGKWSGITETGTAGATLAFGDLCYFQASDSRWELVDANLSAGYDKKLGMCVLAAANDGDATEMLLIGKIRADAKFPTLTIGSPVYMGETAGTVVVTQPSTADVCIRVVGYGNTADELWFNPSSNYIIHS